MLNGPKNSVYPDSDMVLINKQINIQSIKQSIELFLMILNYFS
jgi:hypothetical protein